MKILLPCNHAAGQSRSDSPKNAADGKPVGVSSGMSSFAIEILVSSGPRKDPERYREDGALREPGEDAGGALFLPGISVFWIADGTSQEPSLPGFSSRMLAQDIGVCFERAVFEEVALPRSRDPSEAPPNTDRFDALQGAAFRLLKDLWQRRLTAFWSRLSPEAARKALDAFAHCGDGIRRLRWSSTLLFGAVSLKDGSLRIANFGDSCGIVYPQGADPVPVPPNHDRCFITLEYRPDSAMPVVVPPAPNGRGGPAASVRVPKANAFFCFTDGAASGGLLAFLDALIAKTPPQAERLLRRTRALSGDDKTLLIGKRILPFPGDTSLWT